MACYHSNLKTCDIASRSSLKKDSVDEDVFDLDLCVDWIIKNNFTKVCLQFPERLLINSVDIAAYVEEQTKKKTFILGDSAYGSCCVDEVACQHVNADAIIHFGHACLSPVSKLPVLYIFPKSPFDVTLFYERFLQTDLLLPCLVFYDVSYRYKRDELRNSAPDDIIKSLCISELSISNNTSHCSQWCYIDEYSRHKCSLLHRVYCSPPNTVFSSIVYIGDETKPNFNNLLLMLKGCNIFQYSDENGFKKTERENIMKKVSYYVEKVKNADNVGIVVATLGIVGYKEAIEHIKQLCKKKKKKVYILSIGRPTPTKLANFPEIDVFVSISCPESDWGDTKCYLQPIVGLYELDLALNDSRTWDDFYSRDFRDIIGGDSREIISGKMAIDTEPNIKTSVQETIENLENTCLCCKPDKEFQRLVEQKRKERGLELGSQQSFSVTTGTLLSSAEGQDHSLMSEESQLTDSTVNPPSYHDLFRSLVKEESGYKDDASDVASEISSTSVSIPHKMINQLVEPTHKTRQWTGLDPSGEKKPSLMSKGRSGTASSYEHETKKK